jgi:hypothetical protein
VGEARRELFAILDEYPEVGEIYDLYQDLKQELYQLINGEAAELRKDINQLKNGLVKFSGQIAESGNIKTKKKHSDTVN